MRKIGFCHLVCVAVAIATALPPSITALGNSRQVAGELLVARPPEIRTLPLQTQNAPASVRFAENPRGQLSVSYEKELAGLQLLGRPRDGTLLFVPPALPANVWDAVKSLQRPAAPQEVVPIGGFNAATGLAGNAKVTTAIPSQSPEVVSFDGSGGTQASPPDMQLAVGDYYILQAENSAISVWNKEYPGGPEAVWPLADTFFGASYVSACDPWIQYDRQTHRFFVSALVSVGDNLELWLAFSSPDNPLEPWTFRHIQFAQQLPTRDQPKMTVTSDKVIVAWDELNPVDAAGNATTIGGNWVAFSKQSILTSAAAISATAAYSRGDPCLSEPIPVRETSPESNAYIVAVTPPDFQHQCAARMPRPVPSPSPNSGSILTIVRAGGLPPDLVTSSRMYEVAPYSAPTDAPAAASSGAGGFYSADSRVLSALKVGGHILAMANGSCVSWPACVRFLNILLSDPSDRPMVDLNISTVGSYLMYPSVSGDQDGDVAGILSDVSQGFLNADIFYGTIQVPEKNQFVPIPFEKGTVKIDCPYDSNSTATRFGDYAGSDGDPHDPNVVWVVAALPPTPGPVPGSSRHSDDPTQCPESSRIGRIVFPSPHPSATAARRTLRGVQLRRRR